MIVHDEYNTPWLVKPGDPAAGYVNILKRLGYRIMVLPRTMLTGTSEPSTIEIQIIRSAPPSPPTGESNPTVDADGLSAYGRHIRMLDCLDTLVNSAKPVPPKPGKVIKGI